MKKNTDEIRQSLWWYLASVLWLLGGSLVFWGLVSFTGTDLPGWAAVVLLAPGCAAGLRGWSLLTEADIVPPGKQPEGYRLLKRCRVRYFPFLYLFFLVILLLL